MLVGASEAPNKFVEAVLPRVLLAPNKFVLGAVVVFVVVALVPPPKLNEVPRRLDVC